MEKLDLTQSVKLVLTEAIQYNTDAIVSRTLLKNENNNLTLFAFDEGQDLSEHISPFNAFVQALEGEVELRIGGKPVAVKQGEMVLMPANVPHAVKAVTRFKMLLIMMK